MPTATRTTPGSRWSAATLPGRLPAAISASLASCWRATLSPERRRCFRARTSSTDRASPTPASDGTKPRRRCECLPPRLSPLGLSPHSPPQHSSPQHRKSCLQHEPSLLALKFGLYDNEFEHH